MATNENLIPIPGRLHSVASDEIVSGADQIYDDKLLDNQENLNTGFTNDIDTIYNTIGDNNEKGAIMEQLNTIDGRLDTIDGEISALNHIPIEVVPLNSAGTAPNVNNPKENTLYRAYNSDHTQYSDWMYQDGSWTMITQQLEPTSQEKLVGYYTCGTAANTPGKEVTTGNSGYILPANGGAMKIKMTNANASDNATLKIGTETAKPLWYNDERASSTNSWEEGEVISVYYDGENYKASNAMGGGSAVGKKRLKGSQGYITLTGTTAPNPTTSGGSTAQYRYIQYPVKEGDVVEIKGKGNGSAWTWALIDSNDNRKIVESSNGIADYTNVPFVKVIPSGVDMIIINNYITGYADYEWYYAKAGSVGAHEMLTEAYLYGDLRTLAVGQAYSENEAVKTNDKQLLRVSKEIKAMNLVDVITTGDLKTYGAGANASTYKAQKAVKVYNGTETEGLYAIGKPSLVTITVDSSSLAIEEDTDISITIGGTTNTITVTAAASETKDADIAALIAAAFTNIEGWILTDNEDGTLTLKCATAGNNTISISSNTGETGLSITFSAVNGNSTLNQYNNGSWEDVTLAAFAGDYADIGVTDNTKMWQKLSIDDLVSFATVQNTLVKTAKAESISYNNSQSGLVAENVHEALDEVGDNITKIADLGIRYQIGINTTTYKWSSMTTGYSSKFLKVKAGDKIIIKAVNGKCSYSLFASYDHTVGEDVVFATGYGYETMSQGTVVALTAPDDAVMLYVRSDTAQATQTREPVVFISNIDDFKKRINSLEDIATDGFDNADIDTLVFSDIYNKPEQFNLYLHPGTFRRYAIYPIDGFPEDGELTAVLGTYDEDITSIGVFVSNADAYNNSGERLGGAWLYTNETVNYESLTINYSDVTNPETARYIQICVRSNTSNVFPTQDAFDAAITYTFRGSVSKSGEGILPRIETLENELSNLSVDDVRVKEYNIDLLHLMEPANGVIMLAQKSPWRDTWYVSQKWYGAWIDVSAYQGKRYKFVQSGLAGRLAFTTQKYTTNEAVVTYAHHSYLWQVPVQEIAYGIIPDDAVYAYVYYKHENQDRTPAFFGVETDCNLSDKISEYDEKVEEFNALKDTVDGIAANSSQKKLYIGSVVNATTDARGATSTSSTTKVCMTDVLQLPFRGMKITPVIPSGINCNIYVGTIGDAVTGSTIPLTNNVKTTIPSQYEYYHLEFVRNSGLTASEVESYIANGQIQVIYEGKNTTDVFTRNVESMKKLRAASHILSTNGELQRHHLPILIHTTDQHGNRAGLENIYKFAEAIGADAILNTGDTCSQVPQNGYGFAKDLADNSPIPTIVCAGNHDGYLVTSQADIRDSFIEPFRTDAYVMGGDGKTYFYYDLASISLRVISLNSSEAGYATWTDMAAITQGQIDFLYSSLLSTPANYGVVIIMHMPGFYGKTQQSNYSLDPISDNWNDSMLNQWSKQFPFIKPIQDIIDAFIGRTTFSISYENTATGMNEASGTSVSKTGDFSSIAASIEFIAWITGHHHKDKIGYYQNTTHRQLHMNCTCTASANRQNASSPLPKDYEEALDTFNAYIIDRANHKVKIVRIGVDLTVDMKKRDYLEASYIDE